MTRPYADVASLLPVTIRGADVEGSVLNLYGDHWSLTIDAAWEGSISGRALSSSDDDVADHLGALIGEALLAVGDAGVDDVGFQLSDGVLFVSPERDRNPWVLRLPAAEFLGRPGAST